MRRLATLRKISSIDPIHDADAIEVASIDGWKVVVKKDEFKVDDLVIYCEIDSWIPTEIAPFLSKGKEPREYNGVKGERLRTIRLRGQLSQGLILPIPTGEHFDNGRLAFEIGMGTLKEGDDVSDILNIQKYEAPIPACLSGVVRGNFPSFFRKTDQERIQNLKKDLEKWKTAKYTWEVTEKLDGSSCSMYFNNGEFGVCSRNLDLKLDENNTFWRMALAYDVEDQLRDLAEDGEILNIAIQGEVIGEGIQGNPYKIKGQRFYIFDIFDIDRQEYWEANERREFATFLKIPNVPVVDSAATILSSTDVDELLLLAEGKSKLNDQAEGEGLVFKCIENPDISFKAISNKFLLKTGN